MSKNFYYLPLTRREILYKSCIFGLGLGISKMAFCLFKPHFSEAAEEKLQYEARYYKKMNNQLVQCDICFRKCTVPDGARGFCRNKENINGKYYTLVYGRPAALQIDPIEKEPSYHMYPGISIFCTATASCNNRCKFCQNWHLSQRSVEEIASDKMNPEDVVKLAKDHKCEGLSFTYSEPTAFYEFMFDIAKIGKERGFKTLFHTNGSMNAEPLFALLKHMDGVTVDLKGFTQEFYEKVSSSKLEPVLETLKNVKRANKHLEIVNLMIPGLNDNKENVRQMCKWIVKELGTQVPIHFNRFFPAYKLTRLPATPVETLEKAREIAKQEGIEYVYVGNVPGHVFNSTFCAKCDKQIIHRIHFEVVENNVVNGKCKFCGNPIPGLWS